MRDLRLLGAAQRSYLLWRGRYRQVWRANLPLLLFTVFILLATTLAGLTVTLVYPDAASDLIPDRLLDSLSEPQGRTDGYPAGVWSWGLWIAWNNIWVSILCFALGIFFGLGTLYILSMAGIHIGSTLGFAYVNRSHAELTGFVLGHGPLEMSVIVAASVAGFQLGRAALTRSAGALPVRLRRALGNGFCVLAGALPWLLPAALIEIGISPASWIPWPLKALIGLAAASWFWIWTFRRN